MFRCSQKLNTMPLVLAPLIKYNVWLAEMGMPMCVALILPVCSAGAQSCSLRCLEIRSTSGDFASLVKTWAVVRYVHALFLISFPL